MNETEMEFDMSQEELEKFILNIPQILKELEEYALREKMSILH